LDSRETASAYSADTSALIDLHRLYPKTTFPGVWERLEALITDGRLIVAREVLEELAQKDDDLLRWARQQSNFVVPWTQELLDSAQSIVVAFPGLVDPEKSVADADPFVIAAAELSRDTGGPDLFGRELDWCVLTSERSPRGVRIPTVCTAYGVRCVDIRELFQMERWEFR
jgi:hypothetical protein